MRSHFVKVAQVSETHSGPEISFLELIFLLHIRIILRMCCFVLKRSLVSVIWLPKFAPVYCARE